MGMNPASLLGAFTPIKPVDFDEDRQKRAATVVSEANATEAKQKIEDEKAIRGALAVSGGKMDQATIAKIAMVNPRAAQTMLKGQYDQQKAQWDATESELKSAEKRLQIQSAMVAARAQAMRGITDDATKKLVLNSLPDDIASADERAKMAEMPFDSDEFQALRKSTLAQELSQADTFKLENEKIQQGYAAAAESRRKAEEAHNAAMRPFQQQAAKNTAMGGKVDPATGMTRYQSAQLNKAPADPESVREYKYAQAQGFKGSFEDYQNQDANRRRPVTNVVMPTTSGADGGPDATIKGIAEYRINPTTILNQRGVNRQALMNAVMSINPDYDATQYAARNKTTQDFSPAGVSGKALTAADTALAHLATVEELGNALKNNDVRKLNQLFNFIGGQFGSAPPNNFQTAVRVVAPEITKAVVGGQTAQADRKEMEQGFSENASPQQTLGAVKVAARLLAERVKKQQHSYKQAMGRDLQWQFSPESQALLSRFESGTKGGGQSQGFSVTSGGKTFKFDSQQKLDEFKKAAGIK